MVVKAKGFTLIELVIVITIVGILAAVALPRFVNLQSDARWAKLQAVHGAIRSAAALAKARCELDIAQGVGSCTATGGSIAMEGETVTMVNRYPAAGAAGIDVAAQLSDGQGLSISGGAPRVFEVTGATDGSKCRVTYTAAAANAAPTITVPPASDHGC
ncbi:MAG: type II secretion system protein [Rhodocyclaceae bacterium]|nr:type II secretion system protein [Rhodocyclaceae bacterium]